MDFRRITQCTTLEQLENVILVKKKTCVYIYIYIYIYIYTERSGNPGKDCFVNEGIIILIVSAS